MWELDAGHCFAPAFVSFFGRARDYIAQGGDPKKAENTLGARSSLSSFLRPPARPLHHPCENLLVQFPPGKMINVTTEEGEAPREKREKGKKKPFVRSLLLSFAPPPKPHPSWS